MSRSHRDQRGKRINGEILGHSCFAIHNGKVYPEIGGEEVGSPSAKRWAKQEARRMRRREKVDFDA